VSSEAGTRDLFRRALVPASVRLRVLRPELPVSSGLGAAPGPRRWGQLYNSVVLSRSTGIADVACKCSPRTRAAMQFGIAPATHNL
jgi:hypothetical protein